MRAKIASYHADNKSLKWGCNGLQPFAEIIILDSTGFRAKVIIATKGTDQNQFVPVLHFIRGPMKRRLRREMKRTLLLLVGAAFLFCMSSAFAQIGNTQMYFNGGYQGAVWSGGPEGAVATGFYDGSINGVNVGPGQSSPGFVCDDYYDNIFAGEHWTATGFQVSSLNAGNIGNTLFGGAAGWGSVFGITGLQGYSALAYLVNDMFTNAIGNSALQSSISQALWYLTSTAIGRGLSLSSLDSQAQSLVSAALAHSNISLSTYSGLFLYTQPFNPTGPQEMWGQISLLAPEGGSALWYLLVASLACLGAVWQSRRRTPASARLA